MGLPSSGGDTKDERARLDSFFKNDMIDSSTVAGYDTTNDLPASPVPPRPSREFRSPSSTTVSRLGAHLILCVHVLSFTQTVVDLSLVDWANSHLPASLQITDTSGSLCGGLVLLRLAESIKGRPSSPPVLDSAFPIDSNDDKLDGLFRLFDFLLDNDVKMGSVSINDVRQGKRDKIVQLLKALKSWDEKHKAIAQSVGRGSGHVWNDVPLPLLLQ
jgi:hypothetical protein